MTSNTADGRSPNTVHNDNDLAYELINTQEVGSAAAPEPGALALLMPAFLLGGIVLRRRR